MCVIAISEWVKWNTTIEQLSGDARAVTAMFPQLFVNELCNQVLFVKVYILVCAACCKTSQFQPV